jgi:hypothetical protein
MRIAYIGGNIGPGSPAFSTENAYADALRSLGHEVIDVPQHAAGYQGDLYRTCDLTLYTRTHNADALPFGMRWDGAPMSASVHLDVFRGIPEREDWVERRDPLFTTDAVFQADGSLATRAWMADRGVAYHWLPPAADLRHAPTDLRIDPFLMDKIVFVGSEGYHACYPFRPKLVAHLRAQYGSEFQHYGPAALLGTLRMEPLAELYSSDAIFVGDHCFADEPRENYWSDRLPETLGRGGFLIYPRTPGMAEQGFIEGEHLLCYEPGNLADLDEWIGLALEISPAERREISEAGRALILAKHTYPIRAAQMMLELR